MNRTTYPEDDFDGGEFDNDEIDDGSEYSGESEEDDSENDLLECPICHRSVHEDTQQCPHCGDWIEPVYPGERGKKRFWAIVVALIVMSWLVVMVLRLG